MNVFKFGNSVAASVHAGAIKLDFGKVTVPMMMNALVDATEEKYKDCVYPEHSALLFYFWNHTLAVVNQKYSSHYSKHRDKIFDVYRQTVAAEGLRLFYYLLLICTRESRHIHSCTFYKNLSTTFGPEIRAFANDIHGTGSDHAVDYVKKSPPKVPLIKYTQYLEDSFYKGSYSSGYGGPAWGAVAKVLNSFVKGEITLEMVLDTGFTLAHNNGPIFNKGLYYKTYNDELPIILDVQRAGQIPQLVCDYVNKKKFIKRVPPSLVASLKSLQVMLNGDYTSSVDWGKVMDAGALGSYHHFAKGKKGKKDSKNDEALYHISPAVSVKKHKREKTHW